MMPIYDFRDEQTGETVERVMEASKVPSIGTVRTIDGRRLRRLPPMPQAPTMNEWVVRAYSQRPGAAGAQDYNEDGVAVIHGKKQMRTFLDAQHREVEKDGVGQTHGEILGFDGSTSL